MRWIIIDPILQIMKLRLRDDQICVIYWLERFQPRKGIPLGEDILFCVMQSLSRVHLFCNRMEPGKALLSLGQEYWSGLPFVSPGDLPNPGIKPMSPTWQADSFPLSHQGSPGEDMTLPKVETQSNASTTHMKDFFTFQFPLTDTWLLDKEALIPCLGCRLSWEFRSKKWWILILGKEDRSWDSEKPGALQSSKWILRVPFSLSHSFQFTNLNQKGQIISFTSFMVCSGFTSSRKPFFPKLPRPKTFLLPLTPTLTSCPCLSYWILTTLRTLWMVCPCPRAVCLPFCRKTLVKEYI